MSCRGRQGARSPIQHQSPAPRAAHTHLPGAPRLQLAVRRQVDVVDAARSGAGCGSSERTRASRRLAQAAPPHAAQRARTPRTRCGRCLWTRRGARSKPRRASRRCCPPQAQAPSPGHGRPSRAAARAAPQAHARRSLAVPLRVQTRATREERAVFGRPLCLAEFPTKKPTERSPPTRMRSGACRRRGWASRLTGCLTRARVCEMHPAPGDGVQARPAGRVSHSDAHRRR